MPARRALALASRWGGLAVILAAGILMLWWGWRKWPDVIIDFGRELYVPWQIVSGKRLYVDIAYFNGPLSPYLNSLWFRLFGVSLRTLVICNLVILVAVAYLLYRILLLIGSRLSATLGCLTFVTIFALGANVDLRNWTFVCPYSHEATHGAALSLAAIYCLAVYHRRRTLKPIAFAGLAVGLAFLTKVEMFLAAALATATGLALTIWAERPDRRRLCRLLGTFFGFGAAPALAAFALLCLIMPASHALHGTLGSWPAVLGGKVASLAFYRDARGTTDIEGNLMLMLIWSGWLSAVFAFPAAVGLAIRRPSRWRPIVAAVLGGAVLAAMIPYRLLIGWLHVFRPLTPAVVLFGVASFVLFVRSRRDPKVSPHLALRLSMITLAFVLLLKMFFKPRITDYGFVHAMPATMLLIIMVVDSLPKLVARLGGYGGIPRAVALAIAALTVFVFVEESHYWFDALGKHRVASGADTIWSGGRGLVVGRAVREIRREVAPDETLAVFPEGVMLNYLTRRVNPTPYFNFMPPEVTMFGEANMLAAFRAHPPDWVAVVQRPTAEYGMLGFGEDYGRQLASWIAIQYERAVLIEAAGHEDRTAGTIFLWKRRGR